jgi:hypothetical protein
MWIKQWDLGGIKSGFKDQQNGRYPREEDPTLATGHCVNRLIAGRLKFGRK